MDAHFPRLVVFALQADRQAIMSTEEICAMLCAAAGWSDRDAAELEFYDMHGYPAAAEGA